MCLGFPQTWWRPEMKKEIESCCATGKTPVPSTSNPVAECFGVGRCGAYVFFSYVLYTSPEQT